MDIDETPMFSLWFLFLLPFCLLVYITLRFVKLFLKEKLFFLYFSLYENRNILYYIVYVLCGGVCIMAQCLKCGKKTEGSNVFCSSCLEVMDRYPVKPGTVASIPSRPAASAVKARPSNPVAALNELISRQRTLIRWLAGITALLTVLLLGTAAFLFQTMSANTPSTPTIGRNYTTSTTSNNP